MPSARISPLAAPLVRLNLLAGSLSAALLLLTGCAANFSDSAQSPGSAMALSGQVHGGQSPIVGAKIYLYAAGTGGYGSAARSMLTGSGYVTTAAGGNFAITGDYTCQTGDQVYLLASGGNPGLTPATVNNSAIALIAALGPCSSLTSSTTIIVDEATTVAAVYALAPYMTSASSVASSGTTLAAKGVTNAFLAAANLASYTRGVANTVTVGGNGTVPQAEIDTLANALATCVNSDGTGSPCASLFAAAKPSGGTAPTDTVQAALDVALNPGNNTAAIYNLVQATGPFQPTLTAAPHDWSMAITYTGGGLNDGNGIAIDGLGNVWVMGEQDVSVFDPTGTPLSPAIGFQPGFTAYTSPTGLAIDGSNNAWVGVYDYNPNLPTAENPRILKFNSAGTLLSPLAGYTGGGVGTNGIEAVAFDSGGNLWTVGGPVSGSGPFAASKFNPSGVALSPAAGYPSPDTTLPYGPSMFGNNSGDMWAGATRFTTQGTVETSTSPCGSSLDETGAIDHNGNIWSVADGTNVIECSFNGAQVAPLAGYPTNFGQDEPEAVQIDGSGRIWYMSEGLYAELGVMNTSGVVSSPTSGYQDPIVNNNGSDHFAIDGSGSVWVAADGPYLVQYVGLASPVVTPLATALASVKLGQMP